MTFVKKLGSLVVLGSAALMAAGWFRPPSPSPGSSAPASDTSDEWCEVEGVVLTPSGKPFAYATLYARHDGNVSGSGQTDAQGRYRVRSGYCDLEINVLVEDEVVFQRYLMLHPGSHHSLNPQTSRPGAWQSIF